jgi:lon-related putative ATP-dependent protease
MPLQPLSAIDLYQRSDPEQFTFETTDDLQDLVEIIGQPRAVEAIRFGMGINQPGYNIFALGPPGTGKRSLVQQYFELQAAEQPPPEDWCYVYNFNQPYKPDAIRFPAGRGSEFQEDMEKFVQELRTTLLAAFESDEYRSRRQVIEQESQEKQEKSFEELQEQAKEKSFSLLRTPGGLVFAPVRNGEVLSPEEYKNLPEDERKGMETNLETLQEKLQTILLEVPRIQRQIRERIEDLNREISEYSVGGLVKDLKEKYGEFKAVISYLEALKEDVVQNAESFLSSDDSQESQDSLAALLSTRLQIQRQSILQHYSVNLLVDNRESKGAPVIYEDNPTFQNLIGRVEHIAQMGALLTDFTLIKPGSLHRANGGYLILDALKVLQQPYSWEALKRALQSQLLRIESIGQMLSLISTTYLEPEPIPLNVKIAFLGDRLLYYLLSQADPDFDELFKVQADFDEEMGRNRDNQDLYARLIATLIHKDGLKPFDRTAVARVIEQSARVAQDAEKLSMQVRPIFNLLREASYWSQENGNKNVTADDVQRAIDAQIYRSDRVREKMQEGILRGMFLIDTQGESVGQINGLSVIQLGSYSFGNPSRITASIRLGKGDVVNIEREVELSGPIHSKGVLILAGFLGNRYGQENPLSFSASLVFEQSYGGVEGDSASSAELYALLSAISEAPIKQSLAVTGSVSQHGQVQAIGGVNEKIEGFFDICKSRGLSGDQGVLIPDSNVKNLMLRKDVIEAVEQGKFSIYPVATIDEGIEILTGVPAGERDEDGNYPPDSINGRVHARLKALAEKVKELNAPVKEGGS